MPHATAPLPADYIVPLDINGLEGRMLRLPPPKKYQREILLIYGHHSSIERWWGVALSLNRYAAVTMPDLPGFGGMDSFYKIGLEASLDSYADYLATFIKFRYRGKRLTLVGLSLGFVMVTRMLQKYPELASKVELLVSYAGFAHYDDFTFSAGKRRLIIAAVNGLDNPLGRTLFRRLALSNIVLKHVYPRTENVAVRLAGLDDKERQAAIAFETKLWRQTDVRTYLRTTRDLLGLNNCLQQVALPVEHIAVANDHYFDAHRVEQHLQVIFSGFELLATLQLDKHAPTAIADVKAAKPYMPPKLRRRLTGR